MLKGGRVVDPAGGRDGVFDVLIEDGRIARIGKDLPVDGADVFEVQRGWIVAPGLIDIHVHLREPGQEHKETVATGTASAVAGGFTAVACMPNTDPVNDHAGITEFILKKAAEAQLARVYPIGAVSIGSLGDQLAELGEQKAAGCVAFTDDGRPVATALLMRRALEYAGMLNVPIIDHCEDPSLKGEGVAHEGYFASRLGLRGIPGEAESIMVERDVSLAELAGAHVHIAHMSARQSLRAVRAGKDRGVRVTCEVAPHHFTLTDEALDGPVKYDTNLKMNPPLRAAEDREAMLDGIADGTVDAIATDHAPHHADEKMVEFDRAPFGIVGLETAVPIVFDRLVHTGRISLVRAIELLSVESRAALQSPRRQAERRRGRRRHHPGAGSAGHDRRGRAQVPVEEHPVRPLAAERGGRRHDRRRQSGLQKRGGRIVRSRARLERPYDVTRQHDLRRQALAKLQELEVLMRDGHFDYGNGFHGRVYLNPHQLFLHPSTIWRLAQDLLDVLPAELLARTDVVAGPATGGALLAHTLAGLLDGRRALTHPPCSFAPFTYADDGLTLRSFYAKRLAGQRVLIADDVRNTGKTFQRCAQLVTEAGGTVIATVEICDRLEAIVDAGVPNFALAEYPAPENYAAAECPMCAAGETITTF